MTNYTEKFRAGDECTVHVSDVLMHSILSMDEYEMKEYEKYSEYQLHLYNKKRVHVASRVVGYEYDEQDNRQPITRITYPDQEGLVDCVLPFPYSYKEKFTDAKGRHRERRKIVHTLPILYSALIRESN